jgi:hypothetical protein
MTATATIASKFGRTAHLPSGGGSLLGALVTLSEVARLQPGHSELRGLGPEAVPPDDDAG